jgi:hypothetical protein
MQKQKQMQKRLTVSSPNGTLQDLQTHRTDAWMMCTRRLFVVVSQALKLNGDIIFFVPFPWNEQGEGPWSKKLHSVYRRFVLTREAFHWQLRMNLNATHVCVLLWTSSLSACHCGLHTRIRAAFQPFCCLLVSLYPDPTHSNSRCGSQYQGDGWKLPHSPISHDLQTSVRAHEAFPSALALEMLLCECWWWLCECQQWPPLNLIWCLNQQEHWRGSGHLIWGVLLDGAVRNL